MRKILLTISTLIALACFAQSANATSFGAAATCTWHTADGRTQVLGTVSHGYVSQDVANDEALSKVIDAMNTRPHGKADCKIVDKFSGGACGFMSFSKGGRGVYIAYGRTKERSAWLCSQNGRFPCTVPFGGCTD